MKTKTGIFGGSFNPIHNGHISLAQQLLRAAGLDEVWLMVSPQNPLKKESDLADDTLRMEMARLALKGVEGIVASDYEMRLPKPSYTWHTLLALSRDYPDREFVLLMGGDNWALFNRWYHHADILSHYRIVVYPRKTDRGEHDLADAPNVEIFHSLELMDVSSTEIRRRIKAGEDIGGMVPDAVADYIRKEGLYA